MQYGYYTIRLAVILHTLLLYYITCYYTIYFGITLFTFLLYNIPCFYYNIDLAILQYFTYTQMYYISCNMRIPPNIILLWPITQNCSGIGNLFRQLKFTFFCFLLDFSVMVIFRTSWRLWIWWHDFVTHISVGRNVLL